MRTILLLLCAFLPYSLLAQDDSVICGRVMNKDSEPVAYATISVLSESGEYIKSTISIEDGSFELPLSLSGICVLRISHQSYDDLTLKLNFSSNQKLEPILLNRRADVLTEAAIVADRKVIRRKADMVIFSPKYVVGANNAMDLLQRSPGVLVQGGKITMFGAGEAKIYIDGREQKANAEQLAGILQMYSAEDVETIELIHTPSAKYSASGSGGVINIVTKKKYSDFLGGNVSVSHSQNKKFSDDLSTNLVYKQGKMSASFGMGGKMASDYYTESNRYLYPSLTISNIDDGSQKIINGFIRAQFDYTVSERFDFGAQMSFSPNHDNLSILGNSLYTYRDRDSTRISNSYAEKKASSLAVNLHATQHLKESRGQINYELDYFNSSPFVRRDYSSYPHDNANDVEGYVMIKDNISRLVSGKIDGVINVDKGRINTGINISYVNESRDFQQSAYKSFGEQLDNYAYNETTYAGYIEYRRRYSEMWSMNIGARAEYTHCIGASKNNGQNKRDWFHLFPNMFVGYSPNQNHDLNFSITSRVNRPNLSSTNPFQYYSSENTVIVGNPNLNPTYLYKAALGYTYLGSLQFDLYYAYEPNMMTQYSWMDEKDMLSTTSWNNDATNHTTGINMFWFVDKLKWTYLTIIQGVSYQSFHSEQVNAQVKNNWDYTIMLDSQIFFDKKRKFIGNISGSFSTTSRKGFTIMKPNWYLNAGVQYALLNNKLRISLACRNLLASKIRGIAESNNGYNMVFENIYNHRTIVFSANWSWGGNHRLNRRNDNTQDFKDRLVELD